MINRLQFGELLKENEAAIQQQVDNNLTAIDAALRKAAASGFREIFVDLPYAASVVKDRTIKAVELAGFRILAKYTEHGDPAFNITQAGQCVYSIKYV